MLDESREEAHHLQSKLVGKVRTNDETEYHVWFPCKKQLSASGFRTTLNQSTSEDRQTVFVGKEGSYCRCSCMTVRTDGQGFVLYPCKHSLAVLLNMKRGGDILKNTEKYFHSCFLMSNVLQASSASIHTAFHTLPLRSEQLLLGPPPCIVSKAAIGLRIQSRSQLHSGSSRGKKVRHCSGCGDIGHTISRCPAKNVPISERKVFFEDQNQERLCREHGHFQVSKRLDDTEPLSPVHSLPLIYPSVLTSIDHPAAKRRRVQTSSEGNEDDSDEASVEIDTNYAPSGIVGFVRSLFGSSWQSSSSK